MPDTAKEFEKAIRNALLECHRLGYHPTRFEAMLGDSDAVALAKHFVKSGELQDGLKKLKSMGRTDLSLEEIMRDERYSQLFSADEIAAARWRLQQL